MPPNNCCCPRRRSGRQNHCLTILLILSAIPLSIIISLELSAQGFRYRSRGFVHECAKWDSQHRRFLLSTFFGGGVAELSTDNEGELEEKEVLSDADVRGNVSVGIAVDSKRQRLLVVYTDLFGSRFSAVGAYDLESWERFFLTRLSGPDDEKAMADDVAVDEDGNAYITDAKANKIWKLGLNGELLSVIKGQVFTQRKGWYYNFVGLNGIVYHPNGYLLVIHTSSGSLFKVSTVTEEVQVIKVEGSLLMGDGLELISPTKLVVAGTPSGRLVETSDDWETATVSHRYIGPMHRIATSATVKDGKIYLNHLVGAGIRKWKHVLAEAVFLPLKSQ